MAEGCHNVEGKDVDGKGQEKQGKNRKAVEGQPLSLTVLPSWRKMGIGPAEGSGVSGESLGMNLKQLMHFLLQLWA